MNRHFYKNLQFAFLAQFISIIINLIMYLIVPKIVGTTNYAYWQLFIFYTNYAGFFHLGLVDGIYLRLGGKKYNELNFNLLGSQLKVMNMIQIFVSIIFVFVVCIINIEFNRKFILFFTVIYVVMYCVENFLGFVLQAVNLTKKYSIAVIIEKSICLIGTIILLIMKVDNCQDYICLYVISKVANIVLLCYWCREIIFSKFIGIKNTLSEMKTNILVGIILMFSGIAGSLIIGNGRMIVDSIWGIEQFGKISFSISILNMVLLFIKQVSMVLFPTLRLANEDEQAKIFFNVKNILYIILPIVYIFYIPGKAILSYWLPQYTESLNILSITLPICLYDAKMQILGNTYFKVLREEKRLLVINIVAMLISFITSLFFGYVLKNISLIVVGLVMSIIIRSIYSEYYLNRIYKSRDNDVKKTICDLIITLLFMLIASYLNDISCEIIIILAYVIFLLVNKQDTRNVIEYIREKLVVKLKSRKIN